jgi:hypothetical protein
MGPSLSSTLQPGQAFGRYQIVRTIGVGSFGMVYEAIQHPLGRRVALKLLHDRTLAHPDAAMRFEREAMAAARLQHPHSVEVIDFGTHEGVAFLTMELLEGESLQALMRRAGPLPVETIVDLILPIVSAVAAVHDAGIVHRDLKPENFLLTVTPERQWHPKLLDFGIAKVESQGMELTRTNALLGTPCYMSPEQVLQARTLDGRADQWSLGVVVYEALTGRKPFFSDTLLVLMTAITSEDPVALRALRPDVDPALEAAIARAMQRRPDDRFATMRAFGAALLPFASPAVQHLWYGEFMQAAAFGAPSFVTSDDDATHARASQLHDHPGHPPVGTGDEYTELVNTTSQDGAFPQGFLAAVSVPVAQAVHAAARPADDEPGGRTMLPQGHVSGGYESPSPDGVGTGTLAMDVDAMQAMRPRQPTGKMPSYRSTVEMNAPIGAALTPIGATMAAPIGSLPGGHGAPQGPYGQGPYGQGPYGQGNAPQVMGTPGAPVGTLNLTAGEVSRPTAAAGNHRGGRAALALALLALLGMTAFVLVFVKSRGGGAARSAARTVADAAVRAVGDAAAVPAVVARDASEGAVVTGAAAAAPGDGGAAEGPGSAGPTRAPAVAAGPDAAAAVATDAAVAALDGSDPDPEDAQVIRVIRGPRARDAGRSRDGGRQPGGRAHVPIF